LNYNDKTKTFISFDDILHHMMKLFNSNQLVIGKAYLENLKEDLYMRRLERITGLDIKILSRELNLLVKNNILDYELKGKIKSYSLKRTLSTELFLIMSEIYKTNEFLEKNRLLKTRLTELNEKADFLIFGSYASNKNTKKSDLDILIFSNKTKDIREIISRFNIRVHAQYTSINEFRKLYEKKDNLIVEIINNHVLFGKYKEFVKLVMKWIK